MLIDWFTVGAQALNFLILVWLMKRFLYQPVLGAIDAREKLIAAELAEAAAKKAEAQEDRDELARKSAELDRRRGALLSQAAEDAAAEGRRLLDAARKAADALSAERQESLRNDAQALGQAVIRMTQDEVFAIARQALGELATTSLEERLGDVFIRRVRAMSGRAKDDLAKALLTAAEPALVRSAFELPAEQRAAIQSAINETFAAAIPLRFDTAPDLISGIELTTNGQRVGWSLADYLAALAKDVGALLQEKGQSAATRPGAP
jgi:F-type H+-transporting ATPase subunit b